MPFASPLRDTRKNPRGMYARVPQAMAQFVLKIEKLSQIMRLTPILEMARAYGFRPRLWLAPDKMKVISQSSGLLIQENLFYKNVEAEIDPNFKNVQEP